MDDTFALDVKKRIKALGPDQKVYLKSNYEYEIHSRHGISDDEINLIFDPKKIRRIYPNAAFENRIDIELNVSKSRAIKVIIQFDPTIKGTQQPGKVGIITAFVLIK